MAEPRQAIAGQRDCEQQPWSFRRNRSDRERDDACSSSNMERATDWVGMLGEVMGVKLRERRITLRVLIFFQPSLHTGETVFGRIGSYQLRSTAKPANACCTGINSIVFTLR